MGASTLRLSRGCWPSLEATLNSQFSHRVLSNDACFLGSEDEILTRNVYQLPRYRASAWSDSRHRDVS